MKTIDPSVSSFEKLIISDNIYIDKTKYIYNLIVSGPTYYFFSRPRRFGKSLTISTLEKIFEGRKDLFKGLAIEKTDYDWQEFPIIHIDWTTITFESVKDLKEQIKDTLFDIAKKYSVNISEKLSYNLYLKKLIVELSKINKVVILIDEYDSILTNNVNSSMIEEILNVLRGFYNVIKALGENLRLCFITGVTKFSKVGIFSSMNNLTDISLTEYYSTMLGYTQQELEFYFKDYIELGAKKLDLTSSEYIERLKDNYDGYCFYPNTLKVYNPVSINNFFSNGGKDFKNFWISTGGTTKLLFDIAKKSKFDLTKDLKEPVSEDFISSLDIVQIYQKASKSNAFKSLLFQTGYLTIKDSNDSNSFYYLDFPNKEVSSSFCNGLLPLYLNNDREEIIFPLLFEFENANIEKAMEILKSNYAKISHNLLKLNKESTFVSFFLGFMYSYKADILNEEETNKGRIDAVLKTKKYIYIIEFKLNQSSDVAIKQIKEKKYYEKYLNDDREIHLLGINFSTKEKNIKDWREERV